jgi:flagellin-like protein
MLRRILKQKRYFKNIYKEQKGITGLETAIILIAFVVVAAVFAYTVLSAGLFSTQKSQEAVYNGLQETQNTLEVKGSVLAEGSKLNNECEDINDFTLDTDGASAIDVTTTSANMYEGAGALDTTITTGSAGDEAVASNDTVTIAVGDTITFWAQLGNVALDDLVSFGLHTDPADLSSGTDSIAIDPGDTSWHQYTIIATAAGSMYYGLFLHGDGVAQHIYIDDIEVNNASLWTTSSTWTPYVNEVILVLSLATGGQAVDFTPATVYNHNGLLDDVGKANKIVVNYNDVYQHYADIAWTRSFIGNSNGDNMLDPGEKVRIAVNLKYVNDHVASSSQVIGVNHQMTLELKSPKGAILSLQRTMPARLYGINDLH